EEYGAARIVPLRYRNDLRHVAVATVARVDALVSWNFRHLVNLRTRRAVHAVNVRLGYPLMEIVSPEEV
ncbi:MAG: PIN domain nuclease, partial [Candidatus Binatia bacterium]